jgi:hypothetical protein
VAALDAGCPGEAGRRTLPVDVDEGQERLGRCRPQQVLQLLVPFGGPSFHLGGPPSMKVNSGPWCYRPFAMTPMTMLSSGVGASFASGASRSTTKLQA